MFYSSTFLEPFIGIRNSIFDLSFETQSLEVADAYFDHCMSVIVFSKPRFVFLYIFLRVKSNVLHLCFQLAQYGKCDTCPQVDSNGQRCTAGCNALFNWPELMECGRKTTMGHIGDVLADAYGLDPTSCNADFARAVSE